MFGNTCLLGAANFITKLLSFFTLPLFTAWLSPEAFGTVDILLTTVLLLMPLTTLHVPEAIFRFLAAGEKADAVLFSALLLLLLGTGVLFLLAPFLFHIPFVRPYFFYLLGFLAASGAKSLITHILRARGRYTAVALGQIFCALLTILLQILFIRFRGLGVRGYLLGVVFGDACTVLLLVFPLLGRIRGVKFAKNSALFRKMLGYALPLVPTAALFWGSATLDRYMLHVYHGAAAVGVFAAASKLPTLLSFAVSVFMEAWHYTAARTDASERAAVFGRIYRLLLPFGVLATSGLVLLGKPLFHLLFAASYKDALSPLPYLVLSALFSALAGFLGSAYTVAYQSGAALATAALGACVNLLLNFLFIPPLGALGAALASLFSYLVLFVVRAMHLGRSMRFPTYAVRLSLSTLSLLGAAAFGGAAPPLSFLLALSAPLPFAGFLWQGVIFLWRRARFFLFSFKKEQ